MVSVMVTGPCCTGIGPEHEPTGTVTELPVSVTNAGLVNVKLPVTGLLSEAPLQTSTKPSHCTCSFAEIPPASKFVTVMFD